MNKLNHFTKFEHVQSIVEKGLKFSTSFEDWDDKNDSTLIKIYKEITHNEDVGVICFLNDDETIYHWTYFANDDKMNACCIEFKKKELLKEYLYHPQYRCQEVQYDVLKEVSFDNVEELLFTKRYPYRNEREYRIVSLNGGFLPVKDFIQKITLSPFLSKDEFEKKKSELKSYGLNCEINHSTILENKKWIFKAELLKEKNISSLVETRLLESIPINDLKQIHDFLEQFDKGCKLSGLSENSYITRLIKNGVLVGLAITRIIVSENYSKTNCILNKECNKVCDENCQNEIEIITNDKNNDSETYSLILRSLINTITIGSLFIVDSDKNEKLSTSLESLGFVKTCNSEHWDCCVYVFSTTQNK